MVCASNITNLSLKPAHVAPNHYKRSNSTTLSGVVGKFCSGAAAGRGRRGGVVRPREGVWEGIFDDFWRELGSAAAETPRGCRESLTNSYGGGVRDACLCTLSASKAYEIHRKLASDRRISYCALAGSGEARRAEILKFYDFSKKIPGFCHWTPRQRRKSIGNDSWVP